MLDGEPADVHGVGCRVKALLYGFEHVLVLPAVEATFAIRRAVRPCRAGLTRCGVEDVALCPLDRREALRQLLPIGHQ
jgi:hypothetical protein